MTQSLIKPTIENLRKFGAEPLTRWLIAAAKRRDTITYGEAKLRLESEHGFSTIFSPMMGKPAGRAMDSVLAVDAEAPLLNVLLVEQDDRMPGKGAADYMARYFDEPRLKQKNIRKRNPRLWREYFEGAAQDVYAYRNWERLYQRVYKRPYRPDPKGNAGAPGSNGAEKDGLPRGRTGEGQNHKALRLWVTEYPRRLLPRLGAVRTETEVDLLSGDRVDAVYYGTNKTVAIEVKSRDSNEADLKRGVYQCVKYQAILQAMDARSDAPVESVLVTEVPLPGYVSDLAKRLGVKHIKVPMRRTR